MADYNIDSLDRTNSSIKDRLKPFDKTKKYRWDDDVTNSKISEAKNKVIKKLEKIIPLLQQQASNGFLNYRVNKQLEVFSNRKILLVNLFRTGDYTKYELTDMVYSTNKMLLSIYRPFMKEGTLERLNLFN